jgi:hypothetical protein
MLPSVQLGLWLVLCLCNSTLIVPRCLHCPLKNAYSIKRSVKLSGQKLGQHQMSRIVSTRFFLSTVLLYSDLGISFMLIESCTIDSWGGQYKWGPNEKVDTAPCRSSRSFMLNLRICSCKWKFINAPRVVEIHPEAQCLNSFLQINNQWLSSCYALCISSIQVCEQRCASAKSRKKLLRWQPAGDSTLNSFHKTLT